MIMRRFIAVACAAVMAAGVAFTDVSADGPAALAQSAAEDMLDGVEAQSVYVCETVSGRILCQRAAEERREMGHMAKLMTALIAAEELQSGALDIDDATVVSEWANSKQGTQIWLDVGEKISVEELLKSITVGNANDACTALAEEISGSEEAFVKRMNKRAARLGMEDTSFADCCGSDPKTTSTAKDIALLCSELVKHSDLKGYYTTWMDYVRGKAVELVSTNRLVRSYKGLAGFKACSSSGGGECIAVAAVRGEMSVCVVLLGCGDGEGRFTEAKLLLDRAFEGFCGFVPQIDKKYLADIKVTGGERRRASVKPLGLTSIVLPAGEQSLVTTEYSIPQSVKAPIKKGQTLGSISYTKDGKTLLCVEIVAAEDVGVMDMGCALRKCLSNLLNMK